MNIHILKNHLPTLAKHIYTHKHKYLFSTFGVFAIIKTFVLLGGFFGLFSLLRGEYANASFDDPGAICSEVTDISYDECIALIDLYNSTNGDAWTNNDNWLNTGEVCGVWTGVSCECPSPFVCDGTYVRQIILNDNNLVGDIPDSLQNFSWIVYFNVSDNTITGLPDVFTGTNMGYNLFWFIVGNNQITNIPNSLYASQVEYRDFSRNNITYIDPSISGNNSLQNLFIGYNEGLNLPESIWEMTGMKVLGLQGLGLSSLPESFSSFHELEILYLDDNEFTSVPEQILGLTELTELSLAENNITSLSDGIFSGMNLSDLNISSNALSSISEHAFSGLSNLIYLYLDDNVLETLPDGLFDDLSAAEGSLLWTLDLSFNQLTSLPESVYSIPWLQDLIVEGNQLSNISDNICNLDNLNWLDISNNNLTQLPSCFGTLTSIETLSADQNLLTSLPENFSDLRNLNKLTLNNNQLSGSIDFLLLFEHLNADYGNISYNYFSVDDLDETSETFLDTYFLHSEGLYTRRDQYRIHDTYITGTIVTTSGTVSPGDDFTYTLLYGNSGEKMIVDGIVGITLSSGVNFVNSGDRIYSSAYGGTFGEAGDPCYDQLVESSTGAYAEHLDIFMQETNFYGFSSMYDFTRSFVDGAEEIGEDERGAYFVPAMERYLGSFAAFMNNAMLGEYARDITTFAQCGSGGVASYLLDIGDVDPATTGALEIELMLDPETILTGIILSASIGGQDRVLSIDVDTGNNSISNELSITPLPEDEEEETCGNDIIDEGETCDGENFSGALCGDFGYTTGTLSCSETCTLVTGTCSTETPVFPIYHGGGGGGIRLIQDLCDDLDCSDSYYDDSCGVCPEEEAIHNAADDIFRITGSPYSDEINSAYLRAYSFGITTKPTIIKATIEGTLTRTHLAKMLVNYADKILGLPIITGNVCLFTDISNESAEEQYYALMACKLGLMGLKSDGTPNRLFNPTGEVTRAEFGTALSRLLYGDTYNTIKESTWYVNHLAILKKNRIMKNIRTPYAKELRGWVMLMLMRIGQEK